MTPTVCLMLKAPEPGRVKTRLARDVGPDAAAAIYRRLVERQLAAVPPDFRVAVAGEPADAIPAMRAWLGDGPEYFAQSAGDLGDRLAAATHRLFAAGAQRVLFVGGDCPSLDAEHLRAAALALDAADLALFPAVDGGYCLLGLRAPHVGVFAGIAWSTETVFAETLARATTLGLTVRTLEPALEDVDDLGSWQRALASGSMQNPPAAAST